MIYNDFPILNNDEYELLSKQYSKFQPADRKTLIFKICNELNICYNFCMGFENKFNKKIKSEIENSKIVLFKLLENFTSTFNISPPINQTINSFNLFSFIKKITYSTTFILQWLSIEQKEYYKKLGQSSVAELMELVNKIISALEESNLHFFKHM